RHLQSGAPRHVRAVDAEGREWQLHAVLAERIVGVAARDRAAIVAVLPDVLLPDRLRDHPSRVDRLAADVELATRRPPPLAADADRVRLDEQRPPLARRAAVEVEP